MKTSAFSVVGQKEGAVNPDLPETLAKLARDCLVVCDGYKGVPRDRVAIAFFAGAMSLAPEKMDSSWAFQVALRGFAVVAEWNNIKLDDEEKK